ncbi:hypothetical protein RND61_14890 [Streptomyces sp. TRM76323]|uniref:Thymidine kinase n=1 Tax=Streptomyces tamarix TaxID=3078565 RepID=A0ABU3QKP9_9ACTN|nr:hypothetical protein [Streptomyces tamarix]MDT9683350.1 hypothetical protein [Streptomyces tamarix]
MSKIIFNFGVMNSSKSAQLLMTHHTYLNKGIKPLLIKPAIDDRDGVKTVSSRIGLSYEADLTLSDDMEIEDYLDKYFNEKGCSQVIMVDEAQFISPEIVHKIVSYARLHNLSVIAYGLLKTFQNKLFEGTQAWIEDSDTLVEVKTSCSVNGCNRKATCNLRLRDGKPVYNGDTVQIGGEESYIGTCYNHWANFMSNS